MRITWTRGFVYYARSRSLCDELVTRSRGEEPEELGEEICLPGTGQQQQQIGWGDARVHRIPLLG